MKRILVLTYGLFYYMLFLAVFLYAIGFLGNLLVPNSIDAQPVAALSWAIGINPSMKR